MPVSEVGGPAGAVDIGPCFDEPIKTSVWRVAGRSLGTRAPTHHGSHGMETDQDAGESAPGSAIQLGPVIALVEPIPSPHADGARLLRAWGRPEAELGNVAPSAIQGGATPETLGRGPSPRRHLAYLAARARGAILPSAAGGSQQSCCEPAERPRIRGDRPSD